MYMKSIIIPLFLILIYYTPMVNACEIHMKDGRIITATVWEEDW